MSAVQQVTVLGATGSIGLSTLDVIARHPERYQVFALTGFSRLAELQVLCVQHRPRYAVVPDDRSALDLQGRLRAAGLARERILVMGARDDTLSEFAAELLERIAKRG